MDDELENDSIAPLDWPECASSAATFGNGPYHGLSLADDGFSRVLEVVGAVQVRRSDYINRCANGYS